MNHKQLNKLGKQIEFTEEEVGILLKGTQFEQYPDGLKEKGKYLGLDQWPGGIAKNIQTLIDIADNGY